MVKKWGIILFLGAIVWVQTASKAQSVNDSLILRYRSLSIQSQEDSIKYVYTDSLRNQIKLFLDNENSFSTPLSQVPYLGDIYSPDESFRMVTWNLTLTDGTYDYFCFIQMKPDKDGYSDWHELMDHHKEITRAESRKLSKQNWYGALYYSIIPFKLDKETMYVLLGWEGNNKFSNKKLIESMYFSPKGEPVFGKTVFEGPRLNKRRVIFEYSKEAYLMLRYNEKLKQIIFNELEPTKPELEGLYSFYQPTMTYNAYQYKKGEWHLVLDVKPQNKKSSTVFHNPEDLKKPKIK
tara:strand:+ start:33673 stop:34551 length:879 start_codon:yes stop_codon:yes gene_type:complete